MVTRANVSSYLGAGDVDKADLIAAFNEGIDDDFVDVASATTTDIAAAESRNVRITGTTTITAFGTIAAGRAINLRFAGALTLTHNATSLILPGGANIATVAGDRCIAVSLGSGNWMVLAYSPATQAQGRALLGVGATGANVFVAATTADALSAIGAPAIPTNSAGLGNWTQVVGSADGALTLPAGGSWAWFALRLTTATGATNSGSTQAGVSAGGASVVAGVSGSTWIALVWRVV